MKRESFALVAIMATGLTLSTAAFGQSLTFDLSNYMLGPTQVTFGSDSILPAGAVVTDVEWNIIYQAGDSVDSGSWASELSLELISPWGAANAVNASDSDGFFPGTVVDDILQGFNAGTFVWGNNPAPFTDDVFTPGTVFNSFGWFYDDDSSVFINESGSLSAFGNNDLLGSSATGLWMLRIFDTYNDTDDDEKPAQGTFFQGSHITIYYTTVPTPGALALLGVAGLLGARRRRG